MNTLTSEREKETAEANGRARLAAILVCFAAMGWLIGRSAAESAFHQIILVVSGTAVGFVGIFLYTRVLYTFNPSVKKLHGASTIKQTVHAGFLMLIPFTILAIAAEIWLAWNAVFAFVSAGIMLSGVAVGAELAKLGKLSWRNTAVSALVAGLFVVCWISVISLVQLIL